MEINKENDLELEKNTLIGQEQEKFINTTLGKTINTGIDIGLRAVLPDLIEDKVIELKNNLLEYGLKDGINKTVQETIQDGKNLIGIVTGTFDNVSQIQSAIKTGGTIDKLSYALDFAVNQVNKAGLISDKIYNVIKEGKNILLTNIESNIEGTLEKQAFNIDNIEKHIDNWKENYNNHDFKGMTKEYNKIEKEIKEIIPFEKTIKAARYVENIHNLIKNNGGKFDLSQETLELANIL